MTPISATAQFKAIAYLRWRLFANSFRRKGGTGELVARIIVYPIGLLLLLGAITGSFFGAWAAAHAGNLPALAAVFWAIFVLQTLVSINISAPTLSFDPSSLIRFPLSFPRYLLVRIFLGLLAASTVVSTCALLAAATAVTVVYPGLFAYTFTAALALALTNMLFTRMVFAWVDRWLSTRRAREFFTGFIIVASIGFQYVNLTINGVGRTHAQQRAKYEAILRIYHFIAPVLHHLPPGLAADSIVAAQGSQFASALLLLVAVLIFAAAFLAIFAWRMQREYRGENLSEANHASQAETITLSKVAAVPQLNRTPTSVEQAGLQPVDRVSSPASSSETAPSIAVPSTVFPPILGPLMHKEFTYVRRNPAQFYGLLAPLAMVVLFSSRMGHIGHAFLFPAAAAYSSLGISALAYNILGTDANGIQFYFLSPVSFHTIFLAKNLFGFALTGVQFLLIYAVLFFIAGPPGILTTIAVLCWMIFAAFVNATVGNMRSITAPKKIDPAKVSRRQASQLSALIALGIMMVVIAAGALTILIANLAGLPWLPIPVFLLLAGAALMLYWSMLSGVDALAQKHRETLIEELSKVE